MGDVFNESALQRLFTNMNQQCRPLIDYLKRYFDRKSPSIKGRMAQSIV